MTVAKDKYIKPQTFMSSVQLEEQSVSNPLLRKDESALVLTSTGVTVRTFDLSDEEDLKDYTKLLDGAANKKLEIVFLSRHWDEASLSMRAYAEWRKYALVQEEK